MLRSIKIDATHNKDEDEGSQSTNQVSLQKMLKNRGSIQKQIHNCVLTSIHFHSSASEILSLGNIWGDTLPK